MFTRVSQQSMLSGGRPGCRRWRPRWCPQWWWGRYWRCKRSRPSCRPSGGPSGRCQRWTSSDSSSSWSILKWFKLKDKPKASVWDLITCRDIVRPDSRWGELPHGQAGNRVHGFVWKNMLDKIYLKRVKLKKSQSQENLNITQDHVRSEVRWSCPSYVQLTSRHVVCGWLCYRRKAVFFVGYEFRLELGADERIDY